MPRKKKRTKKKPAAQFNPMDVIKGVKVTNDKLGQSKEEYIDTALTEADILWNKLKKLVADHPEFVEMADKDKIELFMKDHKVFQNEFPIVCRYMICNGQYKAKAFKKYLNKVKSFKTKSAENREQGYMEDIWVDRQADYVKYLWEEYQHASHHRFTQHEARQIWKSARVSIKKEFDEFRNGHKKAEEKVNTEKTVNKKQRITELIERIKLGKQKLSKEDMQKLLWEARARVFAQRKDKIMAEIRTKKQVPVTCQSWGQVHPPPPKGNKSSMGV